MCHIEIQIGGWHWHKLLCRPVDCSNNMSIYQITELAIQKLEHFPNIIEFIWSIYMIDNDKIGQTPAKFDNVIDNIFKVLCDMKVQTLKIFLQHTIQHNSNHLYFWCPLVLFHVTKLSL